ncbi:hypothetical protein [Thalassomonas sp. M1454]|uniref:hypothetical protein n=1 Tax=Thalassomonas sp. M1454 TaxID=2594477 RepID=UPI001180D499|nr:hypothetical protein [Thalassomonas sp. M1454]TRX55170.1 hypothetical protein FNN08_11315 [Thalassomonas sp. M1454]
MDIEEKDKGVIAVILKRFEHERYPKLKELNDKVDSGGVLDEKDLDYLEKVLSDYHQVMAVITRHPEYAALAKGVLLMYEEVMNKSQQNQG